MDKRLKVGIIGVGDFALKEHVPGIIGAGGEVVAFCCRTEQVLVQKSARYNVKHMHTNYADLISNPEVEVVTITTPDHTHEEIAVAALKAGKHVYLEKPPTTKASEMNTISRAAQESGKYIFVGSHHLYRDNIQHAKKLIKDGFFGEIYSVETLKLRRKDIPDDKNLGMNMGGITLGSTSHRIDMILYLLDLPEIHSVSAKMFYHFIKQKMAKKGIDTISGLVEDTLIANIIFKNGCIATIRDIHGAHMEQPEDAYCWFGDFRMMGSDAGLKLHPLTIFQNQDDDSMKITIPDVNNDLRAGHVPVYKYLFNCIQNSIKPDNSPERSFAVMNIIDAMYASASENGKQIILR